MRLDKFLSHLKFCTRRDAQRFIDGHEIMACQRLLKHAHDHFDELGCTLHIDGKPIFYRSDIHLMMYKPKGYLSANHDPLHPCVVDLLQEPYSRFDFSIAGRLDLDAEGLLILTTTGRWVHEITSPRHHLDKVYEVILDHPFHHHDMLLSGVTILDGYNHPYHAQAKSIKSHQHIAWITLDQGKFHQVKRMFEKVGYHVLNLKRIQIGRLVLGDLQPGEYKEINKEDVIHDRHYHPSL
jgi:16S rRNA pseudouridine516 synthase